MSGGARPTAPDDAAFMRRALALATRGWGQTAPNPMVGAVVVRDGVVVGEGWHTRLGEAHAEVEALRDAGERARGATMYVTLEPCNHHGRTGPCTDALLAAGVRRVVAATADPHPAAQGGADYLRDRHVDVMLGVEEAAARELIAPFLHALASDRPFVSLKLAVSLDGAISDHTRRAGWLTGDAARTEVHRLRAGHDAVAIGIGTALADDPALTVRVGAPPRVPPRRVVFDGSARLPLSSRLVRSARDAPVIVICRVSGTDSETDRESAMRESGVDVLHAATLGQALTALKSRGVESVLVEGGSSLAGSLVREALVDRLIIFRAPLLLGAGGLPAFGGLPAATLDAAVRWRLIGAARFGDDEMTIYAPLP